MTLVHVGDSQRCHAFCHQLRAPPGNDCQLDTGGSEHLHSVSVARIECLVLDAVVAQQQPAVGEHTVDIEDDELYFRGPRKNFGCRAKQSNHPGAQQVMHDQYADKPMIFIDDQ